MKSTNSKRAKLPRKFEFQKEFKKDWERLNRSGRYDMKALREVMFLLIANDEPLPEIYLDHQLKGEYQGLRECHIGGDFLLIYFIDEEHNEIEFIRTGTHSELFK